jgi:hypothetical protein
MEGMSAETHQDATLELLKVIFRFLTSAWRLLMELITTAHKALKRNALKKGNIFFNVGQSKR